nr:PREDICTED: uncharacterized protein LOC103561096 [Equus przewalskii]
MALYPPGVRAESTFIKRSQVLFRLESCTREGVEVSLPGRDEGEKRKTGDSLNVATWNSFTSCRADCGHLLLPLPAWVSESSPRGPRGLEERAKKRCKSLHCRRSS